MTTKKYKISFSIFNLLEDTQSEIVRLQQIVKTISLSITGATWYNTEAKYAIWIGLGGVILDTILSCLHLEKIENVK